MSFLEIRLISLIFNEKEWPLHLYLEWNTKSNDHKGNIMSNLSISKDDKEWLPQEVPKTGLSKEPLDQDNKMIVH